MEDPDVERVHPSPGQHAVCKPTVAAPPQQAIPGCQADRQLLDCGRNSSAIRLHKDGGRLGPMYWVDSKPE